MRNEELENIRSILRDNFTSRQIKGLYSRYFRNANTQSFSFSKESLIEFIIKYYQKDNSSRNFVVYVLKKEKPHLHQQINKIITGDKNNPNADTLEKAHNPNWRPWSDHPYVVAVLVFVALFLLFTGRSSIPELLNSINRPSFTTIMKDIHIPEDSGAYSEMMAVDIKPNYDNLQGFTIYFEVDILSGADIFTSKPRISPEGLLTFETAPNAFGMAQISIRLVSESNNQNNSSKPTYFRIIVDPVNDPPSFTLKDTQINVTHSEKSVISDWIADISSGPNEHQSTSIIINIDTTKADQLFDNYPELVDTDGTLLFKAKPNVYGSLIATVSVVETNNPHELNSGRTLLSYQKQLTIFVDTTN